MDLDITYVQEIIASMEATGKKIQWVLDNQNPKNRDKLEERSLTITEIVAQMRDALNTRALNIQNKRKAK